MNIIVTGATGNLGQAVVETLGKLGHQLILTQSSKPETPSPHDVHSVDLTNDTASAAFVDAAISKHKKIDAAVLLVGGYAGGSLKDTDTNQLRKMLTLNFETAYNVVRPLMDHLLANESGRIILIGARPALQMESASFAVAYALSKAQIFELARLINGIGAKKHVTASVVVPSTIDTPTNRTAMPKADFSTWVSPNDIAETIAYLLSAPSSPLRDTVLKMYGDA